MPASVPGSSSYAPGGSFRRRAVALVLALGFNLLLVVMLLRLAGITPAVPESSRMVVFGIQAERPSTEKQERKAARSPRKAVATAAAPAPTAAPRPRKAERPSDKPFSWSDLGVMQLDRRDYAASDVGKIAPHPSDQAGQGAGQAAAAAGGADSEGAGFGPNGEKLYYAQWYREPTDAELSTYVAGHAQPGAWAEVACRTIARFHVDDCVELGDSPPGSGLAGRIRQAAFQFLVRPPRVGGKSLVGSWVRIRISFNERAAVR